MMAMRRRPMSDGMPLATRMLATAMAGANCVGRRRSPRGGDDGRSGFAMTRLMVGVVTVFGILHVILVVLLTVVTMVAWVLRSVGRAVACHQINEFQVSGGGDS